MCVAINEKAMNLKESKARYIRGLEGGKGKWNDITSNNKINTFKRCRKWNNITPKLQEILRQ